MNKILMSDWGFYARLGIPPDTSDREVIRACLQSYGPSFLTRKYRSIRHETIYRALRIHHSIQATS